MAVELWSSEDLSMAHKTAQVLDCEDIHRLPHHI